ncbi:MAG: cyclic nucleotide-binding domain-containing protein, partial [Candidatus Lindowbacteria bacterium]|nr:cyclic nucleotide-binding domain-containing protein [Candidatus Lindowbacteria bacterium]
MANDAYDFLRAFLPYKLLDDAQVDRLSRRAKTDSHPFGHIIFNEGDQSDAVYVVKSGHIKIFTEDQSGNQVTLVTLEEGDSFGELGVIQNAHRSTSARAAKDVELVRIDKEDFCELWKDSPVIRANFEKFFDNYAMRSFLRRYTSLGKIPPKVLNKLLSHFKLRPVHEGELVMNEGDEADAYFIIHEGVFEVHQNGKRINVLSNGEGFGERALLSGDQRSASVVAKTGGELYVLFREDFIDSLATVPDIYNILAQLQVEDLDKPALEDVPPAVKTLRQDDGESEKDEEPPPPAHLDPYGVPRIRKLLPFPSIRQYDETDCGAACLAMISQYYGKRMSMGRLRDLANVTTEGASFASLSIAGEALGYSTRGIRTSFQKLKAIHLPAIAHWEDYHYIVVWKITKTHVTIGDPAIGRKKLTIAEFEEGWTGYVLEFLPTSELLDVKSSMTAFNRFAPLLRPHKRLIFDIFLCSLLLDIFGLAQPLFTQVVVDKVFVHDARGLLDALLVGMVLLAVLTAITSALRRSLLVYISTKVDLRLISEFLRHMVRLPMKYFDSRRVGDIMPRVDENEAITRAFVGTIP